MKKGRFAIAAAIILGVFAIFSFNGVGEVATQGQEAYPYVEPEEGGKADEPADHITDAEREAYFKEISLNMEMLRRQGRLEPARPDAVPLSWPVRKADHAAGFTLDAISNFVDHNPAFPNQLRDWNCGTRTYDQSSGYNHKGIDIFSWPFSWNSMDNDEVEIVAAAPGTIVAKFDGNQDRSCSFNSTQWNAVYIRHSDNSIAWYGHLKRNSLTSKSVGDSVALGEKIGIMGSSGNSTGPHLHMELYNSTGQLQDPYQGTCNLMNENSWWGQQPAYRTPKINRLITQSAAVVMPNCDPATPNLQDVFRPGESVRVTAFYRDQTQGQATQYSLRRPDGTAYASWSHVSPQTYSASYWGPWIWPLATDVPGGEWTFRAVFNGLTYEHQFTVDVNATVSGRIVDTLGRGVRGATVLIVSPTSEVRSVVTSSLGYYQFDEVRVGATYTVSANSKRFRFLSRNVAVTDDLTDIDLEGIE